MSEVGPVRFIFGERKTTVICPDLQNGALTIAPQKQRNCLYLAAKTFGCAQKLRNNRLFARSGHMVRNKLDWDASYAVELPKQSKSYQSSPTLLCFESTTA